MSDRFQHIRLLEAILFASAEPMRPQELARFLPEDCEIGPLLEELAQLYANRGVNLVRIGERWAFRSAQDLAQLMRIEKPVRRKLSRAAVETLAIIAYHQPVTRAEIEEIRGVGLSKGTLDSLLEIGWIKPKGRRRTPGRPVTWGTTDAFLDQFGLDALDSLPGQEELKAAGLLDARPAIAALGARGMLPTEGEEAPEEEDSVEGEDAAALLAADFGEAPVAEGETAEAAPERDEPAEDSPDAASPPEDADDAAAEAAAEAESDEEPGADAAAADGVDREPAEACSGEGDADEASPDDASSDDTAPDDTAPEQAAAEAEGSQPEAAVPETAEQSAAAPNGHAEADPAPEAEADHLPEADQRADEETDPSEAPAGPLPEEAQGAVPDESGPKAMAGVEEHDGPFGRAAAASDTKLLT